MFQFVHPREFIAIINSVTNLYIMTNIITIVQYP